jgi:hypothetical protein
MKYSGRRERELSGKFFRELIVEILGGGFLWLQGVNYKTKITEYILKYNHSYL